MLKRITIKLLLMYARSTDNSLDDAVVYLVRKMLMNEKISSRDVRRAIASVVVDDPKREGYDLGI